MKKRFLLTCYPAALLLLLASACKKENQSPDYTLLLTQQPWKYDQLGIDKNLDGSIDSLRQIETCALDDLIQFNPGGTGIFNQGADLCYPGFPQTENFNWQLLDYDQQLEYAGATYTILSINETQLVLYTEEYYGADIIRHMAIYNH